MKYSLTVSVEPAAEPVSLAEARAHLRCDDDVTAEDTLISGLITAAREWVENYCRRSLVKRTYVLRMDCFPAEIRLPRGPALSVTSVTYTDQGGDEAALAADQYQVDLYSEPARIIPAFGSVWPVPKFGTLNAVQVTYTAGYAVGSPDTDHAENVPQLAKTAIKLVLSHFFEHREPTDDIPDAIKLVLAPLEIRDYTLE